MIKRYERRDVMFKRVLVTLDGSPLSEQALEKAVQIAETSQAELTLFRVVTPLLKSYRAGMATISAIKTAEQQLVEMAETYLDGIADGIREKGLAVNTVTILGVPYKEIVDYIEKQDVDLLVMSTRGETGLTRWLLGSVTDHVVRGVSIPVLVVPARGATESDSE
jgi:nucleotide-binding universal stress UspA family protein